MKTRTHFTWPDGTQDDIVLEADTDEELKEKIDAEMAQRNATYGFSIEEDEA